MGAYSWEQFKQDAAQVAKETGYPLAVLLGQAAQETGRSVGSAPGNNFFGIKGTGNAGQQLLQTWEDYGGGRTPTQSWFAKFATPKDAIRAYLNTIEKIVPNWKQYANDPASLITAIKSRGYATDPNYVANVMNTPEYKQYTNNPNSVNQTPQQNTLEQFFNNFSHTILDTAGNVANSLVKPAYAADKNYSSSNNVSKNYSSVPKTGTEAANSYIVQPGDTLWGIAQKLLGSGNRWHELQGYSGNPQTMPIGTKLTTPPSPNPTGATPGPNAVSSPVKNYSTPTQNYSTPNYGSSVYAKNIPLSLDLYTQSPSAKLI